MPRVSDAAAATERRTLSCNSCRQSRVKCVILDDLQACTRCSRKGLHCTREKSKRRFTSGNSPSSSRNDSGTSRIINNADMRSGLPSLSNPFKLLAQASDENEQETIFSILGPPKDRAQQNLRVAQTVETSDVAKWKASFSAGLYTPRLESGDEYDPVACKILSISRAAALFHTYMDQYNDGNVLLDPDWHTFEYVKMHSLLSSVLYLIVARQEVFDGAKEMSDRLDDHITKKLVPDIIYHGYRSVEIVLGMLMMSTFHFSTQYIFDDQFWTYLGHAIRIGTELDINSRIASKALSGQDENVIRHYRAQERAWMTVYITQECFCLQTGRRPFICTENIIDECEDWHLAPYSAKDDIFVIAHIQLRRIYNVHRSVFNKLCNMEGNQENRQAGTVLSKRDLSYYLNRVQEDLKMWYNRFKNLDATSLREARIRLLLNHTKVMLFSMPLQDTKGNIESAKPAIINVYEATVAYLVDLTGPNPLHRLGRGHNSIFINGCYVAVMALKLSTLAEKLSWIDVDHLFSLVEETSIRFSKEWRGPKQRKASSQAYSEYLHWLLSRYRLQQAQKGTQKVSENTDEIFPSANTSNSVIASTLNEEHAPYFVLPSSLNHAQTNTTTDLWQDGDAFFDDTDFLSWAQRFFNDQ